MSRTTGIEWTEKTWNPATGCNKVSHGCTHCYAEILTQRFPKVFPNGFEFTIHPDRLSQPQRWRKPVKIFVNSMSDLFHEEMPLDFLKQVFQVMNDTPRHTFQIVGGESGKGYRPMESEWAISIQRQCEAANTAFFFKQWGGTTPKSKGRSLNGKIYEEMPCTPV